MTRFVDRAVGIDLGTTHSEIALLDPSERDLVIYADRHGRKTVPSAVGWDPATERIVVGRAARALRGEEPPPIESVKRKMGQAVTFALGPHSFTPEQVSAEILKELVRCMAEELARRAPAGIEVRIRRAVITVPAYFDGPQVEATRRAGELAGLEVIGVLQEPTAAALYAEWKHRIGDGTRLVYDLGGGTFDVSILRAVAGEHRVIAIDGDNYLGGDDFDRRFAERLRQRLCEGGWALALDLNDPQDALRMVRLVQLAQEAKEQLSSSEVVHISRPGWLADREGTPVDIDLEVSRAEHESSIADLIDATLARTELALARAEEVAGVGIEDIDRVLLVGGSTRVPAVARRVEQALAARAKSPAVLADDVDTSVALGAALYAATLGGLSFGDGEVEVRATSPLVTRTDTLRLSLALTRVPEAASWLVVEGDGVEHARVAIAPVVRLSLPIFGDDAPPEQALTLRFEGDGGTLASLAVTVWRAEVGPRPSALSRAAVMAKDLSVEIARGARRERKVLVARGAALPTETSTELFTGDRTGTVVLRLCSGLLPIQTLALEVPTDLPVGTPVTLRVALSESMALDARATVAGRELWSRIEPTALAAMPQREELEAMLASGERIESSLWGHRRTLFSWAFRPLAAGLREAASSDPDRVRALASQLERLLVETGEGDEGLTPPWEHFEGTLDAIRRIAFRGGDVMGLDAASWTARLKVLSERGHEAQRAIDAEGWRTVNDEAQAIHETLATQVHASIDTGSPAYLRLRHVSARRHAEGLVRQLREVVLSSAPELRALQERERERLAGELSRESLEPLSALDVDASPSDARQVLNRVSIAHERIEAAIERIPSLGLVRAER